MPRLRRSRRSRRRCCKCVVPQELRGSRKPKTMNLTPQRLEKFCRKMEEAANSGADNLVQEITRLLKLERWAASVSTSVVRAWMSKTSTVTLRCCTVWKLERARQKSERGDLPTIQVQPRAVPRREGLRSSGRCPIN